jgi:hypothetical protein
LKPGIAAAYFSAENKSGREKTPRFLAARQRHELRTFDSLGISRRFFAQFPNGCAVRTIFPRLADRREKKFLSRREKHLAIFSENFARGRA